MQMMKMNFQDSFFDSSDDDGDKGTTSKLLKVPVQNGAPYTAKACESEVSIEPMMKNTIHCIS